MVRGEEGTFFYYLALFLGMSMLGIYFWAIITVALGPTYLLFQWILIMGGILFVGSAFGFASAKTRSSRVSLTTLSGILGGIHSYLIFALFEMIVAIILFAWMAVGLLIAFAAFNWLNE